MASAYFGESTWPSFVTTTTNSITDTDFVIYVNRVVDAVDDFERGLRIEQTRFRLNIAVAVPTNDVKPDGGDRVSTHFVKRRLRAVRHKNPLRNLRWPKAA